MPWFKVDDAFHGHPKVMELSPAAVGVWALAGSWCANYLTDGEIKTNVVRRMGATDEMIQELVTSGLWVDLGDGTYQFKNWGEYQPLKDEVEAERNAARERMKAVRAKKKGVDRSDERSEDVRPNNIGTFGGTSEEVRVTPTLSLSQSLSQSPSQSPALFPVPSETEEKPGRRKPDHPLPDSWKPTEAHEEKAREKNLDVNLQAETFRNHALANDRRARNWNAAFSNWLIKANTGVPAQAKNVPAHYGWANQ